MSDFWGVRRTVGAALGVALGCGILTGADAATIRARMTPVKPAAPAAPAPPAADWATVTFQSGEETLSAELFRPDSSKYAPPYPALIAIHEWWGLNDQVRGEARKFAAEGFIVLAVDLYRGRVTADAEEAHELMRGLPGDRATGDLRAAFRYLAAMPDVWPDRIGSIGWCMGGGYSLELAAEERDLAAAVIYYGRLITDDKRISNIRASVFGFFGEDDRGIPAASVREFERKMKKMRPEGVCEVRVYSGAGHAFANETRPSYNDTAARDAWTRTARNLKDDLDGAIVRVAKRDQKGETADIGAYKPGDRIVYTIWMENDGNQAMDSVEITDVLDSRVMIDLKSAGQYGDIFTDSGMPTWGGRFDATFQYLTPADAIKYKKTDLAGRKKIKYSTLTRKTSPAQVGAVFVKFRFTGGDTSAVGRSGPNPFIGPDNRNDDRRAMDGVNTEFGAKADFDAAYIRYSVWMKPK